ncbi:MAG: CPBP family intramembrane glutamic endopeptidase [Melioribacteraceae bacterium]|nr:CPBP family intramembrane glutamic endopeptidase [Melioribacteraceae bacterium]
MDEPSENNQPGQIEPPKQDFYFNPVTAAFLGLAGIFILYQFGGAILTFLIFGLDFEKADVNSIRLLTVGGQILFILLPSLLLAKFVYPDITTALRVKFPSTKEILVFVGGLVLLTPLLQSFLYIQNFIFVKLAESSSIINSLRNFIDEIDKMLQSTYGSLLEAHSVFEASFIIFVVAVVPAFCEEIFFRGFVQKSFEYKFKPIWSILLTALFFGIYHFNPYGLFALIALGVYFGFAAYLSNSILIPIILHFINNFFAVTAFLILGDEELINSSVTPTSDISYHIISFIILLLVFSMFLLYVKKNYRSFQKPKVEL